MLKRVAPGGNRERLVDCVKKFVKYTIITRPHFDLFSDRFSERPKEQLETKPEGMNDVQSTTNIGSS